MVVNNRSSDAIIPMHRSSLIWIQTTIYSVFLHFKCQNDYDDDLNDNNADDWNDNDDDDKASEQNVSTWKQTSSRANDIDD